MFKKNKRYRITYPQGNSTPIQFRLDFIKIEEDPGFCGEPNIYNGIGTLTDVELTIWWHNDMVRERPPLWTIRRTNQGDDWDFMAVPEDRVVGFRPRIQVLTKVGDYDFRLRVQVGGWWKTIINNGILSVIPNCETYESPESPELPDEPD